MNGDDGGKFALNMIIAACIFLVLLCAVSFFVKFNNTNQHNAETKSEKLFN